MRSTAHGSLATFLLLIPILAIPMLAIFGVPNFAPHGKSPISEERDPQLQDAPEFSSAPTWGEQEFPAQMPTQPVAHSDAWMQDSRMAGPPTQVPATAYAGQPNESPGIKTVAAWESAPVSSQGSFPVADQRETGAKAAQMSAQVMGETPLMGAESQLTWKTAVHKLNELEIRNFRLEPGQQAGQFLFICSYTPQHSPRLSYRFEAEADEPLRAVEKVLLQINQWIASR